MRPNRVALVRRQHEASPALPGVDVEMVEPEVGEDLLELPLAVDGAEQLLFRQLDNKLIGALHHLGGHVRARAFWSGFLGWPLG
jgi:hypothetical protein